jgi:hypothetical protein
LNREEHKHWISKTRYPIFLANLNSESDKVRNWAIKEIGRIAGWSKEPIRERVRKTLLEIWFSAEVDSKSDVQQTIKDQLAALASQELFRIL